MQIDLQQRFARFGVINSAEDESDLIRYIQFNSNLCISNMHCLFGITFILYISQRLLNCSRYAANLNMKGISSEASPTI